MITKDIFSRMALSFNGTEQTPHFDRIGFKVVGRRMFATYLEKDNTANIFLTPEEQKLFCEISVQHIYPVPNKWGGKGATTFDLKQVPEEVVMEALRSAYDEAVRGKKKTSKT
jgi:hypothetical protein